MNYDKIWKIGLNSLSGAAIMFVLLLIPPYLTAFTNESNDVMPELKAQEINPWIDESIAELNDLTLRQVFETNNEYSYIFEFVLSSTLIDNEYYLIRGNNQFSRVAHTLPLNQQFYVYAEYKLDQSIDRLLIQVNGTNVDIYDYNYENDIYTVSLINNTGNNTNIKFPYWVDYDTGNQEIILKNNAVLVNLTSLGIDNLTIEQMDYYHQRYLRYKDSTINDYTTVFNNYLSLAPDSNPLEIVKPIEYYMNIILETYDTISNFWNNVSNLFVVDVIQENAFEIYDKWWFKPFQWLIGD